MSCTSSGGVLYVLRGLYLLILIIYSSKDINIYSADGNKKIYLFMFYVYIITNTFM